MGCSRQLTQQARTVALQPLLPAPFVAASHPACSRAALPHLACCAANGWLEDVSKVEKYEMSEEAYAARDNTYRKYKEGRLAADPTWTLQKEMASRKSAAAGVSIRRDTARDGGYVEPRVVCAS